MAFRQSGLYNPYHQACRPTPPEAARCGATFKLPRHRRGTPYAGFCSPTCVEAHKVQLAHLRASHLEQVFGERLRDAGLAFVPQYPLGPYVVDLAFPQVRLLVEVDGEAHHASPRAQARDDRKDALAAAEGWRLLRVPQFMIDEHPEEAVCSVVEAFLEVPSPRYPEGERV